MRIASNKLGWVTAFAAAAFLLATILVGCGAPSQPGEGCRALTAIASDAQKMQYVKERIAFRLRDKEFVQSLRTSRSFDQGNDRIREFDALDWKYLGLDEERVAVVFNLPPDKASGWDVDRIGSVSIWLNRNFIVVRLNPENSLELSWTPEDLAKLKAVSEDVFVHCEGP